MSTDTPLMTRKMLIRISMFLFLVAGLLTLWHFLSNFFVDPDIGTVNSVGWIAAVEQTGNGSQAVIIKPDGTIVPSPNYRDGANDHDVVWQPDGNRVFFSSDREGADKGMNIYRWNPKTSAVQKRTFGSRSHEKMMYPGQPVTPTAQDSLVISGGVVVDFDARKSTTRQVLPLVGKNPTQTADNGVGSQFGPEYHLLGTSFREAQSDGDGRFIVGIMTREGGGESLVIEDFQAPEIKAAVPQLIATADRIQFAIDPRTGIVVYSAQNWQFPDPDHIPPQFIKGNKVVMPYRHVIAMINPMNPDDPKTNGPLVASKSDTIAFGPLSVSPDGSKVAFTIGPINDVFQPNALVVAPLQINGGQLGTKIMQGAISAVSWSSDGSKLCLIMNDPQTHKSDIYTVSSDGSSVNDVTQGKADFSEAVLSPQTAPPPAS